ncbi:MAG: DUF1848 domain-containing protein [Candidatus Zixiibacteriota bacterium]|nr:MAG: DUF1848 domain-containing protein [candidate division Zixibacteria bacterium]
MIISASRRTDIPAFYPGWFMNRIKAGYVDIANPINPSQRRSIDLNPESVDAIVFWTRNPVPLFKHLDDLDNRGYKYIFLYTITGYPRELEENLPPLKAAVDTFRKLSDRIGTRPIIWRYDPIILSSSTNEKFHLENFQNIAKELSGYTKRVIISFVDLYKKVQSRFMKLGNEKGIRFFDMNQEICNKIASRFRQISESHGMQVQSCAEETDLSAPGVKPGACIDSDCINEIFNLEIPYKKDTGQRRKCLCAQSVDIGAYNTCGYRCMYCYAVTSFEKSAENMIRIDKNGSSLYVNKEDRDI